MGLRSVFARIVLAAVWLSACSESSVLPPVAPSALPEEKIERLGLACPADVRTQSFDGQPVAVGFELPPATGGQTPVEVGCAPEPDHAFGIGSTEVTCSASDVLRQTDSCIFRVTVLGPPKLAVTRFLAFGDSITDGWVAEPDGKAMHEPGSAYPVLLRRDLQSRYLTQEIEIVNSALSGEEAQEAVPRFRREVAAHRPEVVLLMEGTNDLDVVGGGGPELAAQAMDVMVRHARDAGADVFLLTIPPQVGRGAAPLVEPYNDALRSIAARRGAVLFDVHELLLRGACPGDRPPRCIGADGLHPTPDGNRLIAEELARMIVERYDVEILPGGGGPGESTVQAVALAGAGAQAAPAGRGR